MLEHLRKMRAWSDELPDKDLSGGIHGRNFKARKSFFLIATDLELLRMKGQIPQELEAEVDEFVEHYTSDEFHQQSLTSREDIIRANNLLDKVINILPR